MPLGLLVLARMFEWATLPYAAEDAYITFRYAENWARGLGPVYNAGERVYGFSSPLWTAWIALGALLHLPSLIWARCWGIVFDAAALGLGARILEREASPASAWAFAFFYAVFPLFAANAVLGMETSLFVMLLLAAARTVADKNPLAGIPLGLLALTRPEGILAATLVGLRASWRARAIGLAVFGLPTLALASFFGSAVPQSVIAKAQTYGVAKGLGFYWIEGILPAFLQRSWPTVGELQHVFPLAVLAFPALLLGLRDAWRRKGALLPVAMGGFSVLLGYLALGVAYFSWYLVLPLATWALVVAAGLPQLVRHRLVWAALALYVATDSYYLTMLYRDRARVEGIQFGWVGKVLGEISGGRGSVLLEPIGHIGYWSRLQVVDEVGLVSPAVARRRTRGAGWYADTVSQHEPDYLVVRTDQILKNEAFAGTGAPFRSAAERDSILAAYEELPTPPEIGSTMRIYRKRPGNG